MKNFSKFVKNSRLKCDMTQKQFSKKLGRSWITVWRWENEESEPKEDAMWYWIKKINKLK